MNKKFKRTTYPKHMTIDKVKKVILDFLDKHETTIETEDLTLEFWKQQLAQVLAEDLINNGISVLYLKVAKNDGKQE